MKNSVEFLLRSLIVIIALVSCTACRGKQSDKEGAVTTGKPANLMIVGFNYTDKPINEFFVNKIGGGNLHLSSPGDGGGGSVCCIQITPLEAKLPVEIRWAAGACLHSTNYDKYGEKFTSIHHFFKTVEVSFGNYPRNPHYVEVHFFPDGKVEVALTEALSAPRLALDEKRGKSNVSEHCENDKKPI